MSLPITRSPLLQVLVPSLPQNDKTKVFTGLSTQTIGTFYSCKHSNIVKLTTCSSLACHAELCEATDFSTMRKVDSSKTLCTNDDK